MNQMAELISKLSPAQLDRLHQMLKRGTTGGSAKAVAQKKTFDAARHGNFNLIVTKPGLMESLQFQVCERKQPGKQEVEIEVYAAGMNFRDVMIALGMYPASPNVAPVLGGEVSGRIVAVGEDVREFSVGDEVMALILGGFKAFVTVPVEGVLHKPPTVTVESSAGIPVAFLTAFYALRHMAQLAKGERVLIHSAAGGVGLSAIQIAQCTGAEIFVTAGTPEKREFLRSQRIARIMDSRSLDFVEEVLKSTGGEGVDVILNSLAGEAIPKGLEILRPYGRFIELGKRDIMENAQIGLLPFSKAITLASLDLTWLPAARPGLMNSMLREVGGLINEGVLKPLPTRFFPISEPGKAFSFMSQGTHIGKVVFLVKGQEVMIDERLN